MRKFIFLLIMFSCLSFADSVKLGWCPSPSANVAGYVILYTGTTNIPNWTPNVYIRNPSNPCPSALVLKGSNWLLNYSNRVDVGNVTATTISNLVPGVTYYFNVMAYSSFGDEAPLANEVKYTVPSTNLPLGSPLNLRAEQI